MSQPNDLSRCLVSLEQETTLIAVARKYMPATVCQHNAGGLYWGVKGEPHVRWHYGNGHFDVFSRQVAPFSPVLG